MSEDVDLPRQQAGSPPQHLMVTLLADYTLPEAVPIPSAALVELTGAFEVSAAGARAALSRLTRRGVIESLRAGRRTSCALTPGAATQLSGGSRRLARFALDAEEWDGVWTVVAFSLPEAHRDLRHLLRSRLRWHGFAPLYDGVWVSPNAGPDDVVAALAELEVPAMTVFRSEAVHRPGVFRRTPIEAWDLDDIAEQYRAFIARWEPILEQLREGSISSLEALIARTSIMDTYRRFPALDPQLPEAQMPQGWPRARAREVFVGAYDRLGPLAEVRVRQVIGAYDAATADAVRHHTIAGLIEGLQPVSPAR